MKKASSSKGCPKCSGKESKGSAFPFQKFTKGDMKSAKKGGKK